MTTSTHPVTAEEIASIRRRILSLPAIGARKHILRAFLMDLGQCHTSPETYRAMCYWHKILQRAEESEEGTSA